MAPCRNIGNKYPTAVALTDALLIDCPSLSNNPEMVETMINSCPNTGAVQVVKQKMGGGSTGFNPLGWAEWCCAIVSIASALNPGGGGGTNCCDKVPDPPASEQ